MTARQASVTCAPRPQLLGGGPGSPGPGRGCAAPRELADGRGQSRRGPGGWGRGALPRAPAPVPRGDRPEGSPWPSLRRLLSAAGADVGDPTVSRWGYRLGNGVTRASWQDGAAVRSPRGLGGHPRGLCGDGAGRRAAELLDRTPPPPSGPKRRNQALYESVARGRDLRGPENPLGGMTSSPWHPARPGCCGPGGGPGTRAAGGEALLAPRAARWAPELFSQQQFRLARFLSCL